MRFSRSPLAIAAFVLSAAALVVPTGADVRTTLSYATPIMLFVAAAVALFASDLGLLHNCTAAFWSMSRPGA